MKKVYFEIGGKKLMMKVDTLSDEKAKEMVKEKIIFHKVETEHPKPFNVFSDEHFEKLKDIFSKF